MNGPSTKTRRVVVTGLGLLSPLGDSVEVLLDALDSGREGLRRELPFASRGEGAESLPATPAGWLDFQPRDYLPEGNLRPLDRTGQFAVAASQLALAKAGVDEAQREDREAGLVLGTMYGSVHTIAAFDHRALEAGPKYVKPFDFANSVINAAAGQTAIWHRLPGINSTVTGGPTAGLQAIAYAADAIRWGRAELLLAGGAEELCFESYLSFSRSGLLAGSRNGGPPRPVPFGQGRNGLALGEGACLLVLEERERALERGASILAEILGHATTFDVSRGKDRATAAQAMAATVGGALSESGATGEQVAAVSTGANGSPGADLHEAEGIVQALGRGDVPVAAVKGQLGESLGAGAAMAAAVLIESLRNRRLPGIRGLDEVDREIPFQSLVSGSQDLEANGLGLVTSTGFDGNVSALVLKAEEST